MRVYKLDGLLSGSSNICCVDRGNNRSADRGAIMNPCTKWFWSIAVAIVAGKGLAAPAGNVGKPSDDPEVWMTCAQIIQRWGYPVEQYDVTTDDGYILTMFRIPNGRHSTISNAQKPVVFLQHGLESSSYDWINNLPNEAAGYLFADNGFDVWMGNFRGNMYGNRHVTLNPKTAAFWQFSFDEMAKHDLPAMINTALNISKASSLWYVGHSMGTTAAFVAFSQNQDLAKKVKVFYALAPVTIVKHIEGPLKVIAPLTAVFDDFCKLVGYNDFAPSTELMHILADTFCANPVTDKACEDIAILICGPESHQLNTTRMPVYISHTPAGTSTQTIAHYGQMVNSGKFDMFDYGRLQNKKHYGQPTPPLYDLGKMEVPVYVFSGDSDWLADPKDVEALIPLLRNMVGNVYLTDFDHLDFIWGMRAPAEVYWPVIKDIKKQLGIA